MAPPSCTQGAAHPTPRRGAARHAARGTARRRPLCARTLLATATLAAVAALAGCSPPPATGYFPLESGHRWTYAVRSDWENQTSERSELLLETLGEDRPTEGLGPAWHRRSDDGVHYWLKADDSGIYRVAMRHELQAEPEPDQPPRYVLKMPLRVGTEWKAPTPAYLLRRHAEFPPEIRNTHPPVPMTYRIEALGLKVGTPAGDFSDCLRVKGTAVIRLFADPVNGFRDLPLTTTEWYCRGVGLVKLQRDEPTQNSTFLIGGTTVMELTAWQ
ncbi:MAG: hypothetical protein RLY78_3416 [Pseudomonadota bacterium]